MSATVKAFQVQNKWYRHVMSGYHDQVDLVDENNTTLLTFRGSDKVFDQHGLLGSFNADFIDGLPHWAFYPMHGDAIANLGPDMLAAAVQFSRRYIEQLTSRPALRG